MSHDELPIWDAHAAYADALASGAPVVVAAPTGSGKSTTLPGWTVEATGRKVLVVEPRRVACRAVSGFVASQLGEGPGERVGYQVRFDAKVGPRTEQLFVTPGVALNLLASEGKSGAFDFGTVIIDEFHERSWEIDLLVALVRHRRAQDASLGLVLCSATLDVEGLGATLGARVVRSSGRSFPVDVEYVGEGGPSDNDLDDRVGAAVCAALRASKGGDVLVFLPGKREIEACRYALRGQPAVVSADAELVSVHGSLPPERLDRAFGASRRRRVFLSTNVAETSLTLPGVRTVIDSGLARQRVHRAGRSVLAVAPVSLASADQRAGRAGRVAAGHCIRLWAASHVLASTTPPELGRIELDDFVLRAAQCGLAGDALEAAPWLDPPPTFALERARARLVASGALEPSGEPTPRGSAQARTPVSADMSALLVDVPSRIAPDVADLVAVVEVGRDFFLPTDEDAVLDARADLFARARDEVETAVIALRHGDARAHALHRTALGEARRLARALRAHVGATEAGEGFVDRDALVGHLVSRLPGAVFARRARADPKTAKGRRARGRDGERGPVTEPWGNGEIEVHLRPYRVPGLDEGRQPTPPVAGVLLDHEWLGTSGRAARGVGRLLFTVTPHQLVALGIGEQVVEEIRLRKEGGDLRVTAKIETRLGGACLDRGERVLEGAPLRSAVVDLVLANRLRRGLATRLADALHLWSLASQAGVVSEAPPKDGDDAARRWLDRRLVALGFVQLEDLELLDDEELLPNVDELVRTNLGDPRAVEDLRRDFPRTWSHADAVYTCTVDLQRRRVLLEPDNARARAINEPKASLLPRFRGFSVEYRKASRKLRLR